MQAIILAAGMGRRLKELTRDNTKCMVRVNGVTLIERMLFQLERQHLKRIVVVIGYEGKKLREYIDELGILTPVEYVENTVYDKTNNIYSLALAKEFLRGDDTLLLESDLIFEDSVIEELVTDPRGTLALVDKYESWMDGTCMKIGEGDRIEAFISHKNFNYAEADSYYKTVNIYKFSRDFSENCYIPFLEAYLQALGRNEYYEQVLKVITVLDEPAITAKRLNGQLWYEIDDIQDLDIAESLFASDDDQRVAMLQGRYGGYWRYPRMLDFCYLVNPYFPPKRLQDEMEANFGRLLTEYPSGMRVNSLLAAKNFSVRQENILVGNGAAELIKAVMAELSGQTGFIRPTFEEYPNRYDAGESVFFTPQNPDFSYSADEVMEFFQDKNIRNLVLVNPDNPSGNYICKKEIRRLAGWAEREQIRLILDESFVDFAEGEEGSLIRQEVLEDCPHLCIVKSISKCYGVPGLRLGILASGDTRLICRMKKEAAIWNINSFAEFYMQIMEKYKGDYAASLERVRAERKRLLDKLREIPHLQPIPSQANFVMAELTGNVTAQWLTRELLGKYGILIKDLSGKITRGQYIRLAVRNAQDNEKLIMALRQELTRENL